MKMQEVVVFCISYCHAVIKRAKVKQFKEVSSKQSIHSRDDIVEELSRIWYIEIYSVVDPFNHAGIITGTERRSRYNMALFVKNKTGS